MAGRYALREPLGTAEGGGAIGWQAGKLILTMKSYLFRRLRSLTWIKPVQKFGNIVSAAVNIVDVLSNCELFSAVEAAGFQRLATIGRLCQFRKGQVVFRENDPCPGVYVVGQGLVRVFKTGGAGREHVLHMVGPGGSFAEVAAIGNFAASRFGRGRQKDHLCRCYRRTVSAPYWPTIISCAWTC